MTTPIDLAQAFASFTQTWSPRLAAQVNDYDIRLAKFAGEHVWHVHNDTDELFLVIDGDMHIELREDGTERTVALRQGSLFVVPRGTYHKPSSHDGAHVLLVEPTGTLSVGDDHDEVPAHVDITTGHAL
ncbi:cupin domain-containing protein [Actinokineospora inagensis]|uniref:cupin domain-containing protein n=1 Tax=Actinokineospora inagensis TaxID=103730 RepID=UPI00041409D3